MRFDTELGFLGVFFWLFPVCIYICVLRKQYQFMTPSSYPMITLALRAGSILPTFMTAIMISLWAPESYSIMKALAAWAEGYGVYCIFAFMVKACGGPEGAINALTLSQRENPCNCCCPGTKNYPRWYYGKVHQAIWMFAFVRPVVLTIGTIFFFIPGLEAVFFLFNIIGGILTIYLLPSLFLSAHALFDSFKGMNFLTKLLMVKVSVGLILIEDIVQQAMYQFDVVSISMYGRDDVNEEDKFIRAYCCVALAQGALLSYFLWHGFGPRMDLPPASLDSSALTSKAPSSSSNASNPDPHGGQELLEKGWDNKPSFSQFCCDLVTLSKFQSSEILACDLKATGTGGYVEGSLGYGLLTNTEV